MSSPSDLVDVEQLTPAIEVVIENHVDQGNPAVIEGDGILPSLFDRPSVRLRAGDGRVRAVFLYEPEEDVLLTNMQSRSRGLSSQAHAHKSYLYGQWLKHEAEQRSLATVTSRPWVSLADRILDAVGCA